MHQDYNSRYIVISSAILALEELTLAQKAVFAVIHNFKGECYANNRYLADMLGIKVRNLQKHLETLQEKGFITVEYDDPVACSGRMIHAHMDTHAKQCTNPTPCSTPPHAKQGIQDNKVNNISNNKKRLMKPEGFDDFWNAYPKKKNKQQALKAFKTQKINGELPNILADIEKKKSSEDWRKEQGQFIPYPSSYLNGRRWEDEDTVTTNQIWSFDND